ncbi:MAG: hypothetical protein IVW53_10000 [Chloroflexi bacterium]|nr:hypothetical protein [Chloroflexota bacterium]
MRTGWLLVVALSLIVGGCGATVPSGSLRSPAMTTLTGLAVPFGPSAIRYPANWQVAQYVVANSFFQAIAFLGPEPLPDPCIRSVGSISCTNWPPIRLPPNGIVVGLWSDSRPYWSFDPTAGQAVSVGGQPATFDVRTPAERCASIGGDEQVVVTIPMPVKWNWWEIDACLRGPDHASGESTVHGMLGLPRTP